MNRFPWLWVASLVCAVSATGCGLVLDTQARDDAGADAGTGDNDVGVTECNSPSDCDDNNVCNGPEDCVNHQCVGTDFVLSCDDGVGCTVDRCDALEGCIQTPNDDLCQSIEGYCDPENDCQPLPGCESSADCPPATPCQGRFECLNNACVRQDPLTCPDIGVCVVGRCVVDQCVYAPDSARCNTDADSCAVRACQLNTGQCGPPELRDDLCDDGIDCTFDTCGIAGQVNVARCQHTPSHSFCEDGIACTLNVCAPNDPTAVAAGSRSGCAMRLNDEVCIDGANQRECVHPICLPTGCDVGVEVERCTDGGACDVVMGFCDYSEGCPDNCANYGSPCAPAVCVDGGCETVMTDPCISTTDCSIGFCDISDGVPRCATRPDPLCLPDLSDVLPILP